MINIYACFDTLFYFRAASIEKCDIKVQLLTFIKDISKLTQRSYFNMRILYEVLHKKDFTYIAIFYLFGSDISHYNLFQQN